MAHCTRSKQRGRPKGSKNINSRKGSSGRASKIRFMNFTSEDLSSEYVQVHDTIRTPGGRNICHWMDDGASSRSTTKTTEPVNQDHGRKSSNESGYSTESNPSIIEQNIRGSTSWQTIVHQRCQDAVVRDVPTYPGFAVNSEDENDLPLTSTTCRFDHSIPIHEPELLSSPEVPLARFSASPTESVLSREQSPLYYGSTGFIYEDPRHYASQLYSWPAFATNDHWMLQYPYDATYQPAYSCCESFPDGTSDAMASQNLAF